MLRGPERWRSLQRMCHNVAAGELLINLHGGGMKEVSDEGRIPQARFSNLSEG